MARMRNCWAKFPNFAIKSSYLTKRPFKVALTKTRLNMKKITRIFTLLLLFTFVFGVMTADAQRTRKRGSTEEYFDESGGFAHRLWYGGGFNLNFGSAGGGSSLMILGLSPMIGYKINDVLSIGPRVSLDYYEIFIDGSNPRYMFWGIGPFARGKFSETIFAQVEYQIQGVSGLNDASDIFPLAVDNRENFFLGVGYQSSGGGLLGYEIMALYNFLDDNELNIPISFRFGLNWNF